VARARTVRSACTSAAIASGSAVWARAPASQRRMSNKRHRRSVHRCRRSRLRGQATRRRPVRARQELQRPCLNSGAFSGSTAVAAWSTRACCTYPPAPGPTGAPARARSGPRPATGAGRRWCGPPLVPGGPIAGRLPPSPGARPATPRTARPPARARRAARPTQSTPHRGAAGRGHHDDATAASRSASPGQSHLTVSRARRGRPSRAARPSRPARPAPTGTSNG